MNDPPIEDPKFGEYIDMPRAEFHNGLHMPTVKACIEALYGLNFSTKSIVLSKRDPVLELEKLLPQETPSGAEAMGFTKKETK